MPHRAVEVLALSFPMPGAVPGAEGGTSGVVEEFRRLVEHGTIAVLDALYVVHEPDGRWRVVEIGDGDDAALSALEGLLPFGGLHSTATPALLSVEDGELIATGLPPGMSAVVLAYEHTWARPLRDAVRVAGGAVALQVRIPPATLKAVELSGITA
jgi:hypothetical protein